ncbi:MAG: hypothetical protein ACRCYQ_07665 [Nocardioides sp.]
MTPRSPSRKRDIAALTGRLRADGLTWVDVAAQVQRRHGGNYRAALRLAHGWSQQQVADQWTQRWPDDPKSFKNISTWELWPVPTGHAPCLDVLGKLAELYQCSVADLLADGADFRLADEAQSADARIQRSHTLDDLLPAAVAAADEFLDEQYLDAARQQISHLVALDNRFGADQVADVAARFFRVVSKRLGDGAYRPSLRRDVQALAGELAEVAGWFMYDANRQEEVRPLNNEALHFARLAGDRDIELLTLQNASMHCAFLGRPRRSTADCRKCAARWRFALSPSESTVPDEESSRVGPTRGRVGSRPVCRGAKPLRRRPARR